MESYALLEPYCSEEDLKYYKTLYALHYASETSNFKRNYIGDAILLLAHKLITEGSEHKAEILDAIANADSGLLDCEYENNLFDAEDHTEEINELKAMLKPATMPSIFEMLLEKVIGQKGKSQAPASPTPQSVENLEGKNVAYFSGADVINSTIQEDIESAGAAFICFERSEKHSGAALLESSRELALTKAGTTLLDALDSGADVLIVENRTDYEMFTQNLKAIESAMGRDINLEFILASDFLASNQTAAA
jgi:hypothetical protein